MNNITTMYKSLVPLLLLTIIILLWNNSVEIIYNLNLRYAQHLSGNGAKWTKLHPPLSIESVWVDGSIELENKMTLELIKNYGKNKVRGGKLCQVKPIKEDAVVEVTDVDENTDLHEVNKRIRFFLDNEWVQNIVYEAQFWNEQVNGFRKDQLFVDKHKWMIDFKKQFMKIDNKWNIFNNKNGVKSYREIITYVSIPNNINKIYDLYLGKIYTFNYDFLPLYNYFKP